MPFLVFFLKSLLSLGTQVKDYLPQTDALTSLHISWDEGLLPTCLCGPFNVAQVTALTTQTVMVYFL